MGQSLKEILKEKERVVKFYIETFRAASIERERDILIFTETYIDSSIEIDRPGNTKGESKTVPLTSCLTGLESAVGLLTIFVFICKTD